MRGNSRPNMGSGQRSSASGSSVWLVYEQVWRVMSQARSQSMAISSTSRRMSSATAIDGCVSFIWIANFSWNRSGGIFWILQMRSMSCSEQDTKKYCCSSRSSLPRACSSFGYSTLVRFSLATFWLTAP